MHDLLQYPPVKTQSIEDIQKLLEVLEALLQQPYGLKNEKIVFQDDEVQIQTQKALEHLHTLIAKVVPLRQLQSMMKNNALNDLSMLLLQPKPPAIFDMTPQEVHDVVTLIYKTNTPAHQLVYYKALLQNSLLLSEIDQYLPPVPWGKAVDEVFVKGIADSLYTQGTEGAAIITF